MSNAFARKHGLDPREDPMVTLQKIAYQSQVVRYCQDAVSHGGGWAGVVRSAAPLL
jgi:hypothetical protein